MQSGTTNRQGGSMTQRLYFSLRLNRLLTSLGCVSALMITAGCSAPLFNPHTASESTSEPSAESANDSSAGEDSSESTSKLPRPNFPPMAGFENSDTAPEEAPDEGVDEPTEQVSTPTAPSEQASTPEADSYRFNPSQLTLGDRVLGLDVVGIDVSAFGHDGYVGTVEFRGNVTVQGTYSPQTELVGSDRGVPCFFVSDRSNIELPRFENDERLPWFCFTNPDAVEAAFDYTTAEQDATIVIDSYTTVFIPSDVYNEARFVRLVESQDVALDEAPSN